jgi:crotonobetainyl-CoA:carnitine CoA-transferase CaiB-like acyl-CoA transferase
MASNNKPKQEQNKPKTNNDGPWLCPCDLYRTPNGKIVEETDPRATNGARLCEVRGHVLPHKPEIEPNLNAPKAVVPVEDKAIEPIEDKGA